MTSLPRIHFLGDAPPQELSGDDLSGDENALKEWLGGKAASLQRLASAGLPTSPGFTISTQVCRKFFAKEGKDESGKLEEDWAAIQQAIIQLEERSGKKFGAIEDPLLLAVRSGAAVSMPGMLETLLQVGMSFSHPQFAAYRQRFEALTGTNLQEINDKQQSLDPTVQLHIAIKAVFQSWRSPRAAAYRQAQNISEDLGTAVTVQAMVDAEVAGVCFTRDPQNADRNVLIVEAVQGLGEALVSGDVTPERTEVRREGVSTEAASAGNTLLKAEHLSKLAEIALTAEESFGYPLDLEWAWTAKQGFVLLQARPIRFDNAEQMDSQIQTAWADEAARLQELAEDERRVWVAHNLGESLALPTPLTWSLLQRYLPRAFCQLYRSLGYRPDPSLEEEGFLELIAGRIYADPNRQAKLFWRHLPLRYRPEAIAAEPSLLLKAPQDFQPEHADGMFLIHLPANLWSLLRGSSRIAKMATTAVLQYQKVDAPAVSLWRNAQSQINFDDFSNAELLALFKKQCEAVLQDFWPKMLAPGLLGATAFSSLQEILCDLGGETEGAALASDLIAAEGGTFEQQAIMHNATSPDQWESFLANYGHRCGDEMDLATPRWREDDRYPSFLAHQWRQEEATTPDKLRERAEERQNVAENSLPDRLHEWGGSSWQEVIEKKVKLTRALVPLREVGKHLWLSAYDCLRKTLVTLGERWEIGDDVFYLTADELSEFEANRSSFAETIQSRRQQREVFRRIHLPEVIDSNTLSIELPHATHGEAHVQLTGRALVSGVATARAVVISHPEEAASEGDFVLVCPSTDPNWTPLLAQALALVVERGGALSHGAIVAREFGVPTVACDGAMQQIRSGDLIRVDGTRGVIEFVRKQDETKGEST